MTEKSAVKARTGGPGRPLRARSDEAKESVRLRLIEIGRELFSTMPHSKVTMRKIAQQAGYSTGVVYHYFADGDALFDAIRDAELCRSEASLLAALKDIEDPEARLKAYVVCTRSYTIHIMQLFGTRFLSGSHDSGEPGTAIPSVSQFDPSPASARIHALCDTLLQDLFDTLPCHPLPIHIAADSLIGAINSNLIMAGASSYRQWADPIEVGDRIFDALISYWRSRACEMAGATIGVDQHSAPRTTEVADGKT